MLTPEQLKKVHRLHIRTQHLVNAQVAGNYHSAFRGKGMEFQEVRQYVAGDDVRDIDWNVTARLGSPFVKVYQEERELTVMLLADMSASGIFGSTGQLKRERISELAAILAASAIKNNDKVGLILFTDRIEKVVLPKKGRAHVWRLIRELLSFSSPHRKTNLQGALSHFNRLIKRRSVVFLLSDFLDTHDWRLPLQMATRRHDLLALQIHDPLEVKLPNLGLVQFVDPESGLTSILDTGDSRFHGSYQMERQKRQNAIRSHFLKCGVESLELDCTLDYLPKLIQLFHRRSAKRR